MPKSFFWEQYHKLTTAYIHNLVFPHYGCACWIGNLLNNNSRWQFDRSLQFDYINNRVKCSVKTYNRENMVSIIYQEAKGFYTPEEIVDMEEFFLNTYAENGGSIKSEHTLNEDALFVAFEKSLDKLKAIHERKGEVVDGTYVFEKRKVEQKLNA